jgi:Secretion system C-terminal sorting domain
MKAFFLTAALASLTINAISQNIFIQPGAEIFLQPGAQITLQNAGLINNGSVGGTGTFLFAGNSLQSISGTGTTLFHNLNIGNTGGVELERNININNQLVLSGGIFNIKNFAVSMGPAATVVNENEINRITGTVGGFVEITVPISAATTVNPGNLGAVITPSASMGNVTVRRGHDAQTITPAGRPSINRYFDILPANNTALNAVLTFNYFDAELNGRNEAQLSFWTSPDNTTWSVANLSNRNTATNFVQLNGINTFSKRWTLTDQQFATGVFDLLTNNKTLKLWPNPSTNNTTIYIQLSASKKTNGSLSVVDVSGKTVFIQAIAMDRGLNTLPLNTSFLAKGVYTILVKAEDGSKGTISFIQQ